jgi:hypothetical protein
LITEKWGLDNQDHFPPTVPLPVGNLQTSTVTQLVEYL